MSIPKCRIAAAALLMTVAAGSARADVALLEVGNTLAIDGGNVVVTSVVWWADIGEFYGNGRAYVVPVQLPTLPSGASFDAADLAFSHFGPGAVNEVGGYYGAGLPNYNVDLYGLSRVATLPDVLPADYFSGPADATSALLQNNYLDPTSPGNRAVVHTDASGDTSLAAWLNTMYADGANAGKYVFLRLNPDGVQGALPWSGYQVMTAGAGGADEKPVLSYSVIVPEPSALALLGLGALALRRRR